LPTRNTSFAKNRKKYEGKKIAFVSISVDTKMIMKMESFVTAKQLGGIQLLADNDWNSDFILKIRCNRHSTVYSVRS
jgi:hypothetical protein